MKLRPMFDALRARLSGLDRHDRFFFVGLLLSAIGAWQIYPPAAFIVVGVVFVAISLIGARG